jgi:U3 small nucleolar RNA-associated protein 12
MMLAIGLLDNTIKVFYDDSLKFFLSLYGHKLPVMALDISYDNRILISGSADKTIKIWGLDFGDCHRSLLGHEDSVTRLRFQESTHYFFSASKDGGSVA